MLGEKEEANSTNKILDGESIEDAGKGARGARKV